MRSRFFRYVLSILSREKEASEKSLRVGTFEYMAPEVLLKGKISYKSDIWSFPVVVF